MRDLVIENHFDEILFECTTEVLAKLFNVDTRWTPARNGLTVCTSSPICAVLVGSGSRISKKESKRIRMTELKKPIMN